MNPEKINDSLESQIEKNNELEWSDLGFRKDPFFIEKLTEAQSRFFSSRKEEIGNIIDKVKSRSLPFVLENKIDSETPYILESVVDELLGKEGENLKENKSLPIIIDCENQDKDKMEEVAFEGLIHTLANDNRLIDVLKWLKEYPNDFSLPDSFIKSDEETKDLIERFDMPNLNLEQYVNIIKDLLEDGQVVFILSNLDKIEDEEDRVEFVEKWHNRIQKISGISTIYMGKEGMDNSFKKVNDFYSHSPVKIESIKKEDLKEILNNRVKALSDKYSNINDFLSEDIWDMIRKADQGEDIEWILKTMSKIVEKYIKNKEEINIPIKYEEIKNDMKTLFDKSIPYNFELIIGKLMKIFENSIETLMLDDELTDDNWKDLGIDRNLESDIVDDLIENIPESPQAKGELLNELEKFGFLRSKTIKRKKYYLPVDDFMLLLEIKRKNKQENIEEN